MSQTSELIFAPELDQPIRYIERTRNYYLGLGYDIHMSGHTSLMYRLLRLQNL